MAQTWTELLDEIKVRGMIPTSQATFTEARLLALTNSVLRSKILPIVQKVREGFLSYDDDQTIVSTGAYAIHKRAIGGKLENAALISSTSRQDLVLYDEDELTDTEQPPDSVPGFYIKRSQLYTLPKNGAGASTLRMSILLRPAQIVAQDSAAQITAINTSTKVCTCTTVPSTWTTSNTFEFVQAEAHYDTLALDQAISAITTGSSGTLTFSATLPTRLAVGDWIGLAGQSPVIQVPVELYPLLAQLVACECLKNSPHRDAYKIALEDAKQMREDLLSLLTPRVEKEGKKLVNRTGILRRGL